MKACGLGKLNHRLGRCPQMTQIYPDGRGQNVDQKFVNQETAGSPICEGLRSSAGQPSPSAGLSGAVDDLAGEWFEGAAGAFLVSGRHTAGEGLDLVALNQVDGGATEAASGQARSQTSWLLPGQFDEQIQFRAAVLEMCL